MTTERIKFYQTGTFTAGNRLLDEATRTVQSGWIGPIRSTPVTEPAKGCGEAAWGRVTRSMPPCVPATIN